MLIFYREPNGDYLAIDTSTNRYYRENFGLDHYEGRATGIAGEVGSVCTTGVSREFLKLCDRIARKNVPADWLKAILGN